VKKVIIQRISGSLKRPAEYLSNLEVRLPVEVGGFNVAHCLGFAGRQENEIGREEAAAYYLDNVTDDNLQYCR